MDTITVCMGSSCFSRGNAANAEVIQSFIEQHGLSQKVEVRGCLCEGQCRSGPNVRIRDKLFSQVSPVALPDLLRHELLEKENLDEAAT